MSEEQASEATAEDAVAPPGPAAPPSEPNGSDQDIDSDETLKQSATTIINVMRMQAQNAAFGTDASTPLKATGTVEATTIQAALTAFRSSEAFQRAQKIIVD